METAFRLPDKDTRAPRHPSEREDLTAPRVDPYVPFVRTLFR